MTAEEKIALLTERINELERVVRFLSTETGLDVIDEKSKPLREVKLASALQKKPLLTRQEVMISLGIGSTTLDKWSQPLTEEEEERGDRVYLPPVKSGGKTFYYLADIKSAFRKQKGDEEGLKQFDELEKSGGYVTLEEKEMFLKLLAEKVIKGDD